jgi:hypothetical protein
MSVLVASKASSRASCFMSWCVPKKYDSHIKTKKTTITQTHGDFMRGLLTN